MNWLKTLIKGKPKEVNGGLAELPQPELKTEEPEPEVQVSYVPKKERKNWVLSDEEKVEVCKRWAGYETPSSIVKWLDEERGKKVSYHAVYSLLRTEKWLPLIENQRNQFIQGLVEEPLSNKRKRLQYLQRYMEKSEAKGNFLTSINAVDKARLEMEPKNDNFQLQLNQFNMISDEELNEIRTRLEEKLKKKRGNLV